MNQIGFRTRALQYTDPWSDGSVTDAFDLLSLGGGEPRHSQHTGLKALMVAMLEDAIQCYVSPAGRMRADAENWFHSPSRRPVFSFCVVCETLGLDPDAVRRAVERLPRSEGSRRRLLPRSRPNARSCRVGVRLEYVG